MGVCVLGKCCAQPALKANLAEDVPTGKPGGPRVNIGPAIGQGETHA